MKVLWNDVDPHVRGMVEGRMTDVVRLETTGKYFVLDGRGPRWHESGYDDSHVYIHQGTSSTASVRRQVHRSIQWDDESRETPVLVVEARNATMVKNWLIGVILISVRKGTNSMTTRKQELEARMDALSRETARLASEVARLASRPEEPSTEPGATRSIVTFNKRYQPHGKLYRYAALQVKPNEWVLTGRETGKYTWDALLDFMDGEGTDTDPMLSLCTERTPIATP